VTQKLIEAFTEMREQEAVQRTQDLLGAGTNPLEILEACKEALAIIGQRFECGKAFVPELILAGEIMNQIMEALRPTMESETSGQQIGTVLIGTVEGDIHDIGKDVVVFMLEANGLNVVDLGVDVDPQAFVDKIREIKPTVVGLSGLLTLAFESMKLTVDAIAEAGLRDNVKIMIGGAPVDEHVQAYAGADAWGKDAMEAVSLAKQWIGG
jgi:trimethylamine corrinoid protein